MRASRLLPCLILGGLLARVLYLGEVSALPFFSDPVGDSARYLERARAILAGDLVGDRPFFYGGIFYPYMVAINLRLFGANLYPICLAQAMAGCLLALVLHRFTLAAAGPGISRETTEKIALIAATICLFYGPFAFLESDLLMISWTLLLTMTAALLLLRARSVHTGGPGAVARAAASGLCLGLAASERPNLIALVPALVLWVVWFWPGRNRLRAAAALTLGACLVVFSVAALNHAASGRWVMLTTSSGINFYIGNHPGARGTFDEPWSETDPDFTARHPDLEEASVTMASRLARRELDPVQASDFWFARGFDYVSTHSGETAALLLRKMLLFWNAAELPNHLNFSFMRASTRFLWLMPLSFGLVAPLALYGAVYPGARKLIDPSACALLAILVLVPMVTVLPFFVADRYRAPVVPPLIVAAAFGAAAVLGRLSSAVTRRVACLHLLCLILAGVAMAVPLTRFDQSRDHWLLAQAYKKQGRLPEAVASYREALESSPDKAAAAQIHNNLGVALAQLGQTQEARWQYQQAMTLVPEASLAHRNLGLLMMLDGPGASGEAASHLLVAEKADPEDLEVARALAALSLATGDHEGARQRALKVLAAVPDDPGARAVLSAAGEAPTP